MNGGGREGGVGEGKGRGAVRAQGCRKVCRVCDGVGVVLSSCGAECRCRV